MKIGVDGNLLCGEKTGMGTVVFNVLKHWKATGDVKIILYVPCKLDLEYESLLYSNGICIKMMSTDNYMLWEQHALPKAVNKDKIDVLWCPYNTAPLHCSCKNVLTINDVIYLQNSLKDAPTLYKKIGMLYRKLVVPKAAMRANKIITISEFAKKEIIENIKNINEDIEVVYLGVDRDCKRLENEEKFLIENGVRKPYILGFGSLEKRKNSMGLIKAYESLDRSLRNDFMLVLFGFRGYERSDEYKYIKGHGLENDIVVFEYVTEEEKNTLYANSRMFVFPSLSEGFGIPILEAYANKTPVITSCTSSLPEVAGTSAILIDPSDYEEIKNGIVRIIDNRQLAEKMIHESETQLNLFDWEITARNVLSCLLEQNSIRNSCYEENII